MKTTKICVLLILLLCGGNGYAQLAVRDKQIGAISDHQGAFVFQHDRLAPADSIQITCLGYQKLTLAAAQFGSELQTISVTPVSFEIGSVSVTPRTKELKIGNTGNGMTFTPLYIQNELQDTDYKGREFGTTLKIKRDCLVKDFNVSIAVNKYDSIKFRLLFYRVENNLPTELAVNQEIIFEVKERQTGWFSLDLSAYGIQFAAGDQIAVSLMTLNETDRHEFWIRSSTLAGGGLLQRDSAGGEWKRSGMPGVSMYLKAKY